MTRVLDRERERQAREISRAATALRSIERLMRAGTVFPYDITLRDEPSQTVLVVEGTTTADLHVAAGTALVRRAAAIGSIASAADRSARSSVSSLRRSEEHLDPPDVHRDRRPTAGEHVLTLPAGSVAVARHVGPYEEMGLAEHALYAWAEEHGFEPNGPIREVYRNEPAQVAPEALETDVLLPVSRPSARTPGTGAARR